MRAKNWFLLLGLAAVGCGSKGEISGKVSYHGQHLPAGSRVLFQVENGSVFSANIQADGSYEVDKVPTGQAQIAIYVPQVTNPLENIKRKIVSKDVQLPGGVSPKKDFNRSAGSKWTIPPKYGDPKTSGLTYTVISGKQQYDIDLK